MYTMLMMQHRVYLQHLEVYPIWLYPGKIVCMSFAENKPTPSFLEHTGAILTDDNELYYKILHLRKHGKPS